MVFHKWYKKTVLKSLNTIAINMLYIDGVKDNAYLYGHAPAQDPLPQGSWNFTVLVNISLVIITIYLV